MKEQLEITDKDTAADAPEVKQMPPMDAVKTCFMRSGTIGQLVKALALATLEFPEITKDTENPYFKSQYADLATLIKATRPALAKHGVCLLQFPQTEAGKVILTTMITHASGECLAFDLDMPVSKQDAQGVGSAITYARRYSYQSILNIAGEEDDDGNAATGKTQADYRSRSDDQTPGKVNPVQVRSFWSACTTGKKTREQALEYLGNMGYESPDEMGKHELETAIKWALGKG
jgi:hypothetical protein